MAEKPWEGSLNKLYVCMYVCMYEKNLYVGSFNFFSYTIQIGSICYMDTGVRDLKVAFFKANST